MVCMYSSFRLKFFFFVWVFGQGRNESRFCKLSRTLFLKNLVDFGGQKRTLHRIGKWRTQEMGFAACFAVWLGLFGCAYGKGLGLSPAFLRGFVAEARRDSFAIAQKGSLRATGHACYTGCYAVVNASRGWLSPVAKVGCLGRVRLEQIALVMCC